MSVTDFRLLKTQLNLDHFHDDGILQQKLNVAEEWIGNFTGTAFANYDPIPASLTEAALMLAAYWYEQREAASEMRTMAVPFGVHDMLRPYRESVVGYVPA